MALDRNRTPPRDMNSSIVTETPLRSRPTVTKHAPRELTPRPREANVYGSPPLRSRWHSCTGPQALGSGRTGAAPGARSSSMPYIGEDLTEVEPIKGPEPLLVLGRHPFEDETRVPAGLQRQRVAPAPTHLRLGGEARARRGDLEPEVDPPAGREPDRRPALLLAQILRWSYFAPDPQDLGQAVRLAGDTRVLREESPNAAAARLEGRRWVAPAPRKESRSP
jgi:hypothetical protein